MYSNHARLTIPMRAQKVGTLSRALLRSTRPGPYAPPPPFGVVPLNSPVPGRELQPGETSIPAYAAGFHWWPHPTLATAFLF